MKLLKTRELWVLMNCPERSWYAMDLLDLRAKCRLNRLDAAKIIDRLVQLRLVSYRRIRQGRNLIVTTPFGAYFKRQILRAVHQDRLESKPQPIMASQIRRAA